MNKFFLTLTTALLLSACGQSEDNAAASSASNIPPAAPASSASDSWITDNGEQTNALPQPASIPHIVTPASAPAPASAPILPADTASAAKASSAPSGKLASECESLINRMSRCYDRLPEESAAEMKATLNDLRASLVGTDGNICKTTMTEEFNGSAAALGCE
ncbi:MULTISPECIES: hypothetical protein [Neisseria]|uniref:hypothetical protein n=1 Tax=Neisseria TaxID=482 RepID=UPI0006CE8D09|nr:MULTISPECIES: hypothetical protein [Neisseria]KPN71840.1 hypothetical protein AKG09_03790 [Neisseria sp. 83E34]